MLQDVFHLYVLHTILVPRVSNFFKPFLTLETAEFCLYVIAFVLFQKLKYVNDMHSTFQQSFSVAWNEKLSCED